MTGRDLALALAAFAFALAMLVAGGLDTGVDARAADALGVAMVALATLPLAFVGRHPLGVFLLSVAATAPLHALEYPDQLGLLPALPLFRVALAAADDGRRRRDAGVALAGFGALIVASLLRGELDAGALAGVALWVTAWVAGDRARLRRERMAALEERAEQAEREAEGERRLAKAEERTTIARELHDSAGHAINVILVQAGAARLLAERDPEASRAALDTVETVARETIGEIDRLVGALRDDSRADGHVAPLPGVAALDRLFEARRGAGLELRTGVKGSPRRLAAAVDTAAYRIVQEALTNAARHGGGSAEVALGYGERALEISVLNPLGANGAGPRGDGHGIAGMRERAELLGGGLEAAAAADRFRVRATLPYAAGSGA